MTTQYNPDEVARLVAEAREDDARMEPNWRASEHGPDNPYWFVSMNPGFTMTTLTPERASAIARTRNNLRAMADQLEAAGREIARLAESVETMKDEVWEVAEDSFKCGRIAADLGCLVANSPSDAVQRLAIRYEEATAERDKLQADVDRLERDGRTTRASLEAANEHLRGLLDGTQASLASAQAELEAARPVVEAAYAWRSVAPAKGFGANTDALTEAVDAYRAAQDTAGDVAPLTGPWVCPTCKDPRCG